MDCFMGLDSGGSKTECVLCDREGHILHYDLGKGCNAQDLGYEVVEKRLSELVRAGAAAAPGPIWGVYAALAGIGPKKEFPANCIAPFVSPETNIRVLEDGPIIISSMLGNGDGCSLIAGTGSSVYVRKAGKVAAKIGGRGYLIDTAGSGFEIGRDGIAAAYRALDGQGEDTVLVQKVTDYMEGRPFGQWRARIYAPEIGGRRFIAAFAPRVMEAWQEGDRIASDIVDFAAEGQARMVRAAAKHFDSDFFVVCSGGLHLHYPRYTALIQSKCPPQARLLSAAAAPVYGAVVEALLDAGIPVTDQTRENFVRDYAKFR